MKFGHQIPKPLIEDIVKNKSKEMYKQLKFNKIKNILNHTKII